MQILTKVKEKISRQNIVALFYLFIVIWIAKISIYRGLSQYFVNIAKLSKSDSKISSSLVFDSNNPEAYKTRGVLFLQKGNYQKALINYKLAVELQPNDYLSWVRLGYTYYKLSSFDNALIAYQKAENLAPNYAQPKRYIGDLFIQTGNTDQAFQYFSRAAAIDETLLPEILQIASKTFSGNAAAIENAMRPTSIKAKKEIATYFLKNKIMSDGIKQFLLSDELNKSEKDEFIDLLIRDKNYGLAFAVWASKDKTNNSVGGSTNLIMNGGFENSIETNETGFGWRVNQTISNVSIRFDDAEVYTGDSTILLQFSGASDPSNEILSQLSIVEPNQNYRLTFAARGQELITGGLPIVTVNDADYSKKIIGQSSTISERDKWQKYTIDFKTTNQTKLIKISIYRSNCSFNPCPVFGKLWFDDFELKKVM